ncbi:MAG TPA: nuclear transport factor 2 family protein [Thermoplasmata archaeon]|jgi:ketosteroid isomerase-like protein|nr:nuclear transport factor 2 family protein [Thermoplasmata archaeon]HTW55450.1 nuclear transport factor 2 family protein [Thermoplasmata archaeon]
MDETDADRVALRFVNEINRHDVEALLALTSPDHVFVDARGHEVRGRDRLREAWTARFARCPDYRVVIEHHLHLGAVVGLFGTATGSDAEPGGDPAARRWKSPAAWRAVVRDGRIERWQVYGDEATMRRALTEAVARPPV